MLLRGAAILALAAGVSACSVFDKKAPPPCPTVKIDRETVKSTQFRAGNSEDITDVVMETEITGYTGECTMDEKHNAVDMSLIVSFKASLGPAAAAGDSEGIRRQGFKYFVALPDFFPHPKGKQVFSAEVAFPPNVNQVRYRDEEISLHIPLAKDQSSADARVYLGMQLTESQLQYNRKSQPQY